MKSKIQSVLFPIKKYSIEDARKWLNKEKLKPIKRVHKTDNFYRYRIENPKDFQKFTIKTLNNEIELIIGWY